MQHTEKNEWSFDHTIKTTVLPFLTIPVDIPILIPSVPFPSASFLLAKLDGTGLEKTEGTFNIGKRN